jgi:hypothetical protein
VESQGDIAMASIMVNANPGVLNASSGLLTIKGSLFGSTLWQRLESIAGLMERILHVKK